MLAVYVERLLRHVMLQYICGMVIETCNASVYMWNNN